MDNPRTGVYSIIVTMVALLLGSTSAVSGSAYTLRDLGVVDGADLTSTGANRIFIDDAKAIGHGSRLSNENYSITFKYFGISNYDRNSYVQRGDGPVQRTPQPTEPHPLILTRIAAQGVNHHGEVIAYGFIENTPMAFFYNYGSGKDAVSTLVPLPAHFYTTDPAPITINTPVPLASAGFGINDAGQMVGALLSGSQNLNHAFISDGITTTDLNALIDPNSGLSLTSAVSINNFGQIAGYALDKNNKTHEYLLTPSANVPEPSSLAITTFLVFAMGCARAVQRREKNHSGSRSRCA